MPPHPQTDPRLNRRRSSTGTTYLTSETEADLNQGGVSLLQLKFPQRAVPEYLHKAVINFRCKQFLDVDQVQRQFKEQLDRLETAQEKHRRDPATEHQDLSWSGNLLLIRGKISDIAQQMSRQCNEAITTYNASPDTNGNGIANKPIKAKMDFWQQMKTHNAGAIASPLPTSRVPPIPEGFRTKLKRRPWPICQRERRTSSAKNSKE